MSSQENKEEHDKYNCEECQQHMTNDYTSTPQTPEWKNNFISLYKKHKLHLGYGKVGVDKILIDFIQNLLAQAEERGRVKGQSDVVATIYEIKSHLVTPLKRGELQNPAELFKYHFIDSMLSKIIDKYKLNETEIDEAIKNLIK